METHETGYRVLNPKIRPTILILIKFTIHSRFLVKEIQGKPTKKGPDSIKEVYVDLES